MIRLIWLFLVIAAIAMGAAFVSGQTDDLVLSWAGTTVRMAPAVAAGLAVAAVAVLLVLWRLFGFLFDWPGAMSRWRLERRRRRSYLALAKGMVAVAAGDAREARRHQARARKGGQDEPLLSQLLSAQVAQLEGDDDGAARAYADMLGRSETEFLGLRGLFVQAMRREDRTAARRHAARAFQLRPQTPWVAAALFDLEAQAGDWAAAEKALDGQARAKLLTADDVKRRRAVLSAAAAGDLLSDGKPVEGLARARAAMKAAPDLLAAALAAAEGWRSQNRPRRAAAVLERAWAVGPHPDIAAAYAALQSGKDVPDFGRLISLNPSHPESQLLSAAAEARMGRYNEAEVMLKPLLKPQPPARAARLMADIAAARGETIEARLWSDRASRAPADGAWVCSSCRHEAGQWTATCRACGAFDTMRWTHPVAAAGPVAVEGPNALYRLNAPVAADAELMEADDTFPLLDWAGEGETAGPGDGRAGKGDNA
jgi:HemY protein